MPFPIFYSGASMFGIPWLDFNAGSFLHMAGRLRCGYGCTGETLSMELKAQHWLDRNSLRTGWWEVQEQQGSPADWGGSTTYHLLPYILYLLEYAPPEIADLDLAESLARLAEEHFMHWGVEPRMEGTRTDYEPMMGLARIFLLLHRRTGDPLHLAKADALIAQRLRNVEPVWGQPWLVVSKSGEDVKQHPVEALKTLALRRQIQAQPPAAKEVPANGHVVLTLDRLVEGTYRVVVHLWVKQRSVDHAIALTPTRQPIDVDLTQPGRLHVRPDTVLHHAVEASGLKVGPQGLDGDLVLHLASEAKPLRINIALTSDYGLLRGAWKSGEGAGRAAAEIRTGAVTKPRRTHVEASQAAVGGEAWQNWAAALWQHAPDGTVASNWFGNNNSGWSATVKESALTLTDERIEGSLCVAVTWDGVADPAPEGYDDNQSGARFDPDGHRTKEWREGKKAWLANWKLGTRGKRGCFYYGGFKPSPPYVADNSDVLIYRTTWKEVAGGGYVYRIQGRRLGDVVAGTVTIKGPVGKEHGCQFLGGVE